MGTDISPLTNEQMFALLERWRLAKDRQAWDELIILCLPFVRRVARKYSNSFLLGNLDDVTATGIIALAKAINGWRPKQARSWLGYLKTKIRAELGNELSRQKTATGIRIHRLGNRRQVAPNSRVWATGSTEDYQSACADPAQTLTDADSPKEIQRLMKCLSPTEQAIITDTYFSDLSANAVTRKNSITQVQRKALLTSALAKMKWLARQD